ncbi:hypothetical protein MPSEU_000642400 [Mayamaea pseudoterrestris]|nr:hypothetical protein MPSEU_000642400 [Mayamaea pseudoterrestris]
MASEDDSDPLKPQQSPEQLRDVVDALRQPLTGRNVLLPFSPRAFVKAKLSPALNDDQEELVQVRLGDGYLRQMTRSEAKMLLEEEYKEKTKSKTLKTTSALKQSLPPDKNTKIAPAFTGAASFFDIREEIDESGNPIGGEAIDITQRLQQMEIVAASQGQPTPSSHPAEDKEDDDDAKTIAEDDSSLRVLNDDEYGSLAARLDELARLEELTEQEATANEMSRSSIKGKSWKKGFLNKKPASVKSMKVEPTITTSSTVVSQEQSRLRKSVAFADAGPDVKEIPRIGERSIKEEQETMNRLKKPTGWSKGFLNNKKQTGASQSDGRRRVGFLEEADVQEIPRAVPARPEAAAPTIKSFDENVFSSVVAEHVVTEKPPQEPPVDEPKRLSKFAQRRMEMQQ